MKETLSELAGVFKEIHQKQSFTKDVFHIWTDFGESYESLLLHNEANRAGLITCGIVVSLSAPVSILLIADSDPRSKFFLGITLYFLTTGSILLNREIHAKRHLDYLFDQAEKHATPLLLNDDNSPRLKTFSATLYSRLRQKIKRGLSE